MGENPLYTVVESKDRIVFLPIIFLILCQSLLLNLPHLVFLFYTHNINVLTIAENGSN